MSRLKTTYEKEIIGKLMSKLSLKNKHDVPKIEKVILKWVQVKMRLMKKIKSLR